MDDKGSYDSTTLIKMFYLSNENICTGGKSGRSKNQEMLEEDGQLRIFSHSVFLLPPLFSFKEQILYYL